MTESDLQSKIHAIQLEQNEGLTGAEKEVRKKLKAKQKLAELAEQNPNICCSVRPGEPTTIKIWNQPLAKHDSHPINRFLRQLNQFCTLSLMKAASHRTGSSKGAPSFETNKIAALGKELQIEIPKNLAAAD